MKTTQIINTVLTDGAMLIRPTKGEHAKGTPWEYDVKPLFTGSKTGWVILDHTTAHAMKTVFNALSEENKLKFDNIFITRLIDFTWKQVA